MSKTFETSRLLSNILSVPQAEDQLSGIDKIPARNLQKHDISAPGTPYCKHMHDLEISRILLTKSTKLPICSSANCFDCFENLKVKESDLIILAETYFEVFKGSSASLSGISTDREGGFCTVLVSPEVL